MLHQIIFSFCNLGVRKLWNNTSSSKIIGMKQAVKSFHFLSTSDSLFDCFGGSDQSHLSHVTLYLVTIFKGLILTWFFVLKLLEQSSAHKSHVILSNLLGSEPSFEHKPLGMSWFPKPAEIRTLFLFILTFEETF